MHFNEWLGNRYDHYLNKLEKLAPLIKYGEIHGLPLYKIVMDNGADNWWCITAGIHGNEVAGPLAILEWLKKHPDPKVNLLVLPICNPSGFIRNKRRTATNHDLNRHFRDKDIREENDLIIKEIKQVKPEFLISLHEHPGARGFYIYSSRVGDKICESILELAKEHGFTIRQRHKSNVIRGNRKLAKLDGDGSLEDLMYTNSVPYIVVETPTVEPISKRAQLQASIIDLLTRR